MDKKTRKDWDEILGKTPPKEDFSKYRDDLYFDGKELAKSLLCIVLIIILLIMFLTEYLPERAFAFSDLWGRLLPSILLSLGIIVMYAKPIFVFILSFLDDDWGLILVPFMLLAAMPFIIGILLIYNIVKSIRIILRPKL